MSLNIKNPSVHALARRLAAETGTPMSVAIETALREKLARLDRAREVEAVVARVRRMVEESGPTPPGVSSDHSDLYDEAGLPT